MCAVMLHVQTMGALLLAVIFCVPGALGTRFRMSPDSLERRPNVSRSRVERQAPGLNWNSWGNPDQVTTSTRAPWSPWPSTRHWSWTAWTTPYKAWTDWSNDYEDTGRTGRLAGIIVGVLAMVICIIVVPVACILRDRCKDRGRLPLSQEQLDNAVADLQAAEDLDMIRRGILPPRLQPITYQDRNDRTPTYPSRGDLSAIYGPRPPTQPSPRPTSPQPPAASEFTEMPEVVLPSAPVPDPEPNIEVETSPPPYDEAIDSDLYSRPHAQYHVDAEAFSNTDGATHPDYPEEELPVYDPSLGMDRYDGTSNSRGNYDDPSDVHRTRNMQNRDDVNNSGAVMQYSQARSSNMIQEAYNNESVVDDRTISDSVMHNRPPAPPYDPAWDVRNNDVAGRCDQTNIPASETPSAVLEYSDHSGVTTPSYNVGATMDNPGGVTSPAPDISNNILPAVIPRDSPIGQYLSREYHVAPTDEQSEIETLAVVDLQRDYDTGGAQMPGEDMSVSWV